MLDLDSKILKWQALSQKSDFLSVSSFSEELSISRAVFGKADKAGTDYRMLVKSKNFSGNILNSAYIGDPQSTVVDTLSWSFKNNKFFATHYYPSNAKDSTNRQGGIEKHVLEASYINLLGSQYPFILLQLAILNRVEQYRNEIWWQSRNKPDWQESYYKLEIENDKNITKDEIIKALNKLESAIENVKDYFTSQDLIKFYTSILTDEKLVVPNTVGQTEIPIDIFLALFLPFEEKQFAAWSFILNIPDDWLVDIDKITNEWNIIPNFEKREEETKPISDAQKKLAEDLANAVYNNHPFEGSIPIARDELAKENDIVEQPIVNKLPIDSQGTQASTENKRILYSVNLIASTNECYFYPMLDGLEPYENSHSVVKKIFDYLCSEKIFIDEKDYTEYPINLSKADKGLLSDWHRKITDSKYHEASSNAVILKIEYLKAIYLFLSTTADTMTQILSGKNQLISQKIPLLLLFKHIEPQKLNIELVNNCKSKAFVLAIFQQSLSLDLLKNNKYQMEMTNYIRQFIQVGEGYSAILADDEIIKKQLQLL